MPAGDRSQECPAIGAPSSRGRIPRRILVVEDHADSVDLTLPDVDGFAVARALRELPERPLLIA